MWFAISSINENKILPLSVHQGARSIIRGNSGEQRPLTADRRASVARTSTGDGGQAWTLVAGRHSLKTYSVGRCNGNAGGEDHTEVYQRQNDVERRLSPD